MGKQRSFDRDLRKRGGGVRVGRVGMEATGDTGKVESPDGRCAYSVADSSQDRRSDDIL